MLKLNELSDDWKQKKLLFIGSWGAKFLKKYP